MAKKFFRLVADSVLMQLLAGFTAALLVVGVTFAFAVHVGVGTLFYTGITYLILSFWAGSRIYAARAPFYARLSMGRKAECGHWHEDVPARIYILPSLRGNDKIYLAQFVCSRNGVDVNGFQEVGEDDLKDRSPFPWAVGL